MQGFTRMVQSFQQIAMILSVDWNQCSHIGTGFGPSEDRDRPAVRHSRWGQLPSKI